MSRMPTEKRVGRLFFHEKPARMLLALNKGDKNLSALSVECECEYCHVLRLLKLFVDNGVAKSVKAPGKHGSQRIVSLTTEGKQLAEELFKALKKWGW